MLNNVEKDKFMTIINFEETELRLGLGLSGPCEAEPPAKNYNGNNKRGFEETESVNSVDLKLNLSTTTTTVSTATIAANTVASATTAVKDIKVDKSLGGEKKLKEKVTSSNNHADQAKPPSKAQVVGWPPVRSFRKNIVAVQKKSTLEEEGDQKASNNNGITCVSFVKVSMDGAPYLRKVDLKSYKSYQQLSDALGKMFSSFTIGNCGSQGMKDFMNESKLTDLLNGSDYVPTYEDKDGDWMLVGDVPWEMFVESCKRLRIMKGSEAIGLAPRAVEKCKSRS